VFQLRDYTPEDFEEIWILDQICFARGIAYTRPELRHFLLEPSAITIVASADGRIAGFVLVDIDRKGGHIITIDVHPDYRRTGLGSKLMQEAEGRLGASGVSEVRLEVAVDNSTAIAFYKRRGYFVMKSILRYYNDSIDALLMHKRLD
jgi:[ribosomal protein S18]-alanine N-acetyltransferase